MELTNKPHRSKMNAFNILSVIGALLVLPEVQNLGIKPEYVMAATGIINVILRTFFNGKK